MNKNKCFKISELASALGITSRTLRFYEDEGFFSPDYTDRETGYRFYSVSNLLHLHLILQFKKANVPISDIYDFFHDGFDYTRVKEELLQKYVAINRSLLQVSSHLSRNGIYEMAEFITPGSDYLDCEAYCDTLDEVRSTYTSLMFELLKKKVKINPGFSHYIRTKVENGRIKINISYSVKDCENVRLVPPTPLIYTYHVGRYEDIYKAHAALKLFADCEDIKVCGEVLECPLASASDDPDESITFVAIPVERYTNAKATVDANFAQK